eukprot:193230-Rhodomonas_salina.1
MCIRDSRSPPSLPRLARLAGLPRSLAWLAVRRTWSCRVRAPTLSISAFPLRSSPSSLASAPFSSVCVAANAAALASRSPSTCSPLSLSALGLFVSAHASEGVSARWLKG